jgi:hypothetical protein
VTLRKLVGVVPVIVVLALAAPVSSASAQAGIPCYPYPAFCGPNGQPWLSFFFPQTPGAGPSFPFGPGPVQIPGTGPSAPFGPGPVQIPTGALPGVGSF